MDQSRTWTSASDSEIKAAQSLSPGHSISHLLLGHLSLPPLLSESVSTTMTTVQINIQDSCLCLFLVFLLLKGCQTLQNDATEVIFTHVDAPLREPHSNVSINRARIGGRGATEAALDRDGEWMVMVGSLHFSGFGGFTNGISNDTGMTLFLLRL